MSSGFDVIFNVGASRDAIRRALATLRDMTPVYQDIVEELLKSTTERFRTETDPDGEKWARKSQTTLDRYKRLGYSGQALTRTLFLKGYLSGNIFHQAERDRAVIGSPAAYAAVQQFGAAKGAFGRDRHGRPIPWGRIPARAFLGLSDADEEAIIDIVDEHIELDGAA